MIDVKEGKQTVQMMGTKIDLAVTHQTPDILLAEIISRLKSYEERFSANDSNSELQAVNKKAGFEPVAVHSDLFELIKIGKKHSEALNSSLNIAIGPLVQAWRIGFDNARVPKEPEIKKRLKTVQPKDILLNEEKQTVFLQKKGMAIDLGALAKGYIADQILAYLKEKQATSALINLGGNLVTVGPALKRADQCWRIGIQNPHRSRGSSQIILKIKEKSIVTSGIYERSLNHKGRTFHHILDSKTGYPIETDLASLTIVSDSSIDGEIWTSRLFGQPEGQIIHALNQMNRIDGLVITKKGEVAYSNGLQNLVI